VTPWARSSLLDRPDQPCDLAPHGCQPAFVPSMKTRMAELEAEKAVLEERLAAATEP
jgi:hypothetical protein